MKLKGKQQKFVDEYLIDLNATAAAKRAGYSVRTANEQGARLLANVSVRSAISDGKAAQSERAGLTADRVLAEIQRLAFFDVRKLFDDDGRPIHISKLDDDTAAAIAGLDVVMQGNQDIGYAQVLKVKLADKSRNLENLGRHLKLFTDRVEVQDMTPRAERLRAARERKGKLTDDR